MDYAEIYISIEDGSSSRSSRGFEFPDEECLQARKREYLRAHPEHACKYEGEGTIVFPGEWSPSRDYDYPSLPGVY